MSLPVKEIKITRFMQVQTAPANVIVMRGDTISINHQDAKASEPASK